MGEGLNISDAKSGCHDCLKYFGIFKYPLTEKEIFLFNPVCCTKNEVTEALSELVKEGKVFKQDQFYLPENDKAWIQEREAGNARAITLLQKVQKYASIIAAFPFVDGIAISGSLSKNYASEFPDIDYFIITRSNRLWIARTLLHLFKKFTFITGHQHYFCMNYFIDREALHIRHRNIYSAIEVNTLMPVLNKDLLREFQQANDWTKTFQPNHPGIRHFEYMLPERKCRIKGVLEGMINMLAPDSVNRWLMSITDRKWRRKWRHSGYSPEEYNMAFMTDLHVSKNHPMDYEKKVMENLKKSDTEGSL